MVNKIFAVKRIWLSLVVFLIAILIIFAYISTTTVYNVSLNYSKKSKTIIIDAGHGGFDGGASVADILEKDINLKIALNLRDCLSALGYDIILTRDTDSATNTEGNSIRTKKISDMKNRLKIMKNYPEAIFISIHLNKFESASIKGAQVFYSINHENSKTLAKSIQKNIKDLLQNDNHREVKKCDKNTYLLYNSPIPAVIVECGFLSNPNELSLLKSEKYQKEMAYAIFSGVISIEDKG